jgi:hypothetical protein
MPGRPKTTSNKVAAARNWCCDFAGQAFCLIGCCPFVAYCAYDNHARERREKEHQKLLRGKVDHRGPTSYRERYELGLELLNPREWQRRRESYRKPRRPWGHEQSGFAKLPPELRMKIYEMAGYDFAGIHVSKYKSEDRNWGIPCKREASETSCRHQCVAGTRISRRVRQGCVSNSVTEWIPPDPGIGLMNLLMVCRFM